MALHIPGWGRLTTNKNFTTELGVPIWFFGDMSSFSVEYTISIHNLIKLTLYKDTFDMPNMLQQDAVIFALSNAYSYVIKGDELIIYFTKVKNRNLLIFKKMNYETE